jgi:membrane protease YdiL (CAAX protease family)
MRRALISRRQNAPDRAASAGPRTPSATTAVVRRRPLATFFVLAFVLSWWPAALYVVGWSPSPIVGFGPFLAAVVVLAVTDGRRGVVALLRSMVQWRARPAWYAVALLGPVAFAAAAATVATVAFGVDSPAAAVRLGWPQVVGTFLLLLLVPGIGGTWEEPGWRGYAVPRMVAARSPLIVSLVIGVIWAGWHLPLILIGQLPWSDVVGTIAMSVVLTAVYLGSGGSVLLVMVMHAMNNAVNGHFLWSLFAGSDGEIYSALSYGAWSVAAVIAGIFLATGRWRRGASSPA